jgi:hypothetical protein
MAPFETILTHPGGAHKDEVLACSVLLALRSVPVVRREPTPADLADPTICVVDVGHVHDPAKNNFDHHQLPKDQPPTCALSLVLQNLGLYEQARELCEWLEPAEWFDCRGPFATAAWLDVDREVLSKLNSPVDVTVLKRFAASERLQPGEPLWEILRMIGEDILEYVKGVSERLDLLERHAEFWDLAVAGDHPMEVLFLPRLEPLWDDPSMGMDRFVQRLGKIGVVAGLVYPDRRSSGYGLSRFRDDERLDFTRVAAHPDVHFAHARGFVAKTTATQTERLKELLKIAAAKTTAG